jgi:hypothetical protein
MSTNRVALRTVEEYLNDYQPIYSPIYPLFMKNALKHENKVAKYNFKRVEAVGDLYSKHITPKDTEIKQFGIQEGAKSFKAYFQAIQFTISHLQENADYNQVVQQVLDAHNVQMDSLFLTGEGSSNSTMINNGLFWSADANFTEEGSTAIASGTDARLADLHAKMVVTAQKANQVAGEKVMIVYGSNILPLFNGVYPSSAVAFKSVLGEVLKGYNFIELPEASTPSSSHGWIVANLDQVKLHYTQIPVMLSNGSNNENMYDWFNFLKGSTMLEVLAKNAVIKQPATLA